MGRLESFSPLFPYFAVIIRQRNVCCRGSRVHQGSTLKRIITFIWFLFCGKAQRLFSFFSHPLFWHQRPKCLEIRLPSCHVQFFRGNVSRSKGVQLNNSSWPLQPRASLRFRFVRSPPSSPVDFKSLTHFAPKKSAPLSLAEQRFHFYFFILFCFVATQSCRNDPEVRSPVLSGIDEAEFVCRGSLTFHSQRLRTESYVPSVVPPGAWGQRSSGSRYYCQLM